jgi:hypothetical protein
MSDPDRELKHALIEGYRRELKKRYELDNVRRYPVFDPVSDDKLTALREFFLGYIYPPAAERDQLDAASEQVMELFHSPRRLLPLVGTAMTTIFRFAGMTREAMGVTRTTLEAFRETRRLEEFMLHHAKKADMTPADLRKTAAIHDIVLAIPEKEMLRFRNDVIELFRCLANRDLLKAGVEIMDNALTVMRKKRGTYSDRDIEGFEVGRDLLQASLELYTLLSKEEALIIVEGIGAVEEDWYEDIKAASAKRA